MITHSRTKGFTDVKPKTDNWVLLSEVASDCKKIGAHTGKVIIDLAILGIEVIPNA